MRLKASALCCCICGWLLDWKAAVPAVLTGRMPTSVQLHACHGNNSNWPVQHSSLGELLMHGVAPEDLLSEQTKLRTVATMIWHTQRQQLSCLGGDADGARQAVLSFHSLKLMKAAAPPRLVGVFC